MGLPDGDSKEGPSRLVAQLLEREGVPYALIGGVAVQLHTEEPRSTLDIDLIVLKLAAAVEPARRPSKREHDLADVLALLEEHPELASAEMAARVQDVRRRLMSSLTARGESPGGIRPAIHPPAAPSGA